jgi:N-acetylglutamate synthase-like GNAT family acetyltransferase
MYYRWVGMRKATIQSSEKCSWGHLLNESLKVIADMQLHRFVDLENAEFSLTVADSWQGKGLGRVLMDYCITVARDIGIKTLWMDVIKDDWRMIKFGNKYNFNQLAGFKKDDMVEMILDIRVPDDASVDDKR